MVGALVLPTNVPFKTESLAPVMAESTKIIIEAVKEAEIFNLKRAREAAPKLPTVSIPNSQPTIPAQPYRSDRNTAYAPPANRNVAVQYKLNKEKRPKPAYKTLPPVHEPTIAENIYKQSMENYHKIETEVTDIQPTYTTEHSNFTIANTTDQSRSFISPGSRTSRN